MVELLIVVTIFAVLIAIGVPSLINWLPKYRLKAAARELYSDMQKAKLTAIKEDEKIGLTFTTVAYPADGGGYTVFTDNGAGAGISGNGIMDGDESARWTRTMGKQISLIDAAFTGGNSSFSFSPKGVLAPVRQGSVELRTVERWYKITVSASGGLRLEASFDGSTWE